MSAQLKCNHTKSYPGHKYIITTSNLTIAPLLLLAFNILYHYLRRHFCKCQTGTKSCQGLIINLFVTWFVLKKIRIRAEHSGPLYIWFKWICIYYDKQKNIVLIWAVKCICFYVSHLCVKKCLKYLIKKEIYMYDF